MKTASVQDLQNMWAFSKPNHGQCPGAFPWRFRVPQCRFPILKISGVLAVLLSGDSFSLPSLLLSLPSLPPPGEICCVCMGTKRQVQFQQCQHWCCMHCMRSIMYWDETRYHLDPCRFGCPPCPNGCNNPARGTQCYCESYDAVMEEWERTNPAQYQRYNDAEHESIYEGEPANSAFGSRRCPICRQPQ